MFTNVSTFFTNVSTTRFSLGSAAVMQYDQLSRQVQMSQSHNSVLTKYDESNNEQSVFSGGKP